MFTKKNALEALNAVLILTFISSVIVITMMAYNNNVDYIASFTLVYILQIIGYCFFGWSIFILFATLSCLIYLWAHNRLK